MHVLKKISITFSVTWHETQLIILHKILIQIFLQMPFVWVYVSLLWEAVYCMEVKMTGWWGQRYHSIMVNTPVSGLLTVFLSPFRQMHDGTFCPYSFLLNVPDNPLHLIWCYRLYTSEHDTASKAVLLLHAGTKGERMYSSYSFLTSALHGVKSVLFPGHSLPLGKDPQDLLDRGLGRPQNFDPRQRQIIFPLASLSRLALGPTQPPVQWVPGVLSRG
jgi:hypothetical protein